MLGDILRFRPSRRERSVSLLVIVAAVVTGSAVLTNRPGGTGEGTQVHAPGLSRGPMPIVEEPASALPVPAPSSPPSVPTTAFEASVPAAVPPPAPTARSRSTADAAVPIRSRAAHPDVRPWVASSAPLDASPPIRVDIAAVGATAPIGPLGLNRDGTLEVPTDFSRAGWYTGRPTPGESGPAIIVAHRAGRRGPGAFWRLPDVQPGQEIVVTRADRRRIRFTVDRVEQHRKDAFPTGAVYGPTPDVSLRLITCGGPFEATLGDHYRDNVIVFARMTGRAG